MQLQKQRGEIMIKISAWPDLPEAILLQCAFTLPTCRATHSLRQQKHRKKTGPQRSQELPRYYYYYYYYF